MEGHNQEEKVRDKEKNLLEERNQTNHLLLSFGPKDNKQTPVNSTAKLLRNKANEAEVPV